MAGREGSNHEVLLLAIAVATAASVLAAAVDYKATVSKDDAAKAGVIGSLRIALSRRAHDEADTTGAASVAGPASAQATNPKPTAPLDSAPGENLSEKLNQSDGVIHPKEVDPAIEKAAPKVGDPNVAPLPGTSGGGPAPQPK